MARVVTSSWPDDPEIYKLVNAWVDKNKRVPKSEELAREYRKRKEA